MYFVKHAVFMDCVKQEFFEDKYLWTFTLAIQIVAVFFI